MKRSARLASQALGKGVDSRKYEAVYKRRFAPGAGEGAASLLGALLVRSGALPAPPPAEPEPVKRKRGRPRKADVAAIAAQAWADVSDCAGVVLVDGKEVVSKS